MAPSNDRYWRLCGMAAVGRIATFVAVRNRPQSRLSRPVNTDAYMAPAGESRLAPGSPATGSAGAAATMRLSRYNRARLVALMLDVDSNRSSIQVMPPQDNDPRPMPPVRPSREDCCKGSCDPCIFDVYDDALDRYRSDLQAWEERQARWKKDVP